MALLPVEEARARLLADAVPVGDVEMVPLASAKNRVLARDLAATRTQPPFSASAMDGYAVRAADIATLPAELAVIGSSAAGHGFDGAVGAGHAVRIFTGAPLPAGADTVVIQENVERLEDERIRIVEASPGRHVRRRGLDFKQGETLLHAGDRLDAGRLMLAAAMNHPHVPVLRQPVVAVIATGDELVPPGTEPGPDQIIASNAYGVACLVEEAGGRVVDLGIAGDSMAAIQDAVDRSSKADILVTLGGASVGDHDLVQAALTARGMTLDFWKIAMRPGKPLMCGRLGRQRVLGLPGNPVSSLVCAHLFVRPLVARLAGRAEIEASASAILGSSVGLNDGRQDYLRARLLRREDGQWVATPFEKQDSSMVRTFAEADALIVRAPHAPPAAVGEPCTVHILRPPEGP